MNNLFARITMNNLLARVLGCQRVSAGGYSVYGWLRRARRWLGWCMIQLLLATAVMLPFDVTSAVASWVNWPGTSVAVPQDNFTLVGQSTFTPNPTGGILASTEMLSGDKWITLGKETVGTLGITSQQISSAMHRFPKNTMYVFAQYSPENASGRITIQKVEKAPNGSVTVYQADFTPWNGELWRAQGKYRDASEIAANASGHNPFANFAGALTDPVFHNIQWQAMMVAVGHAMRHYGAAFGFVALIKPSHTQNISHSGGGFLSLTTTSTTTVTGYAQPVWYVATAMDASPTGQTGQICVTGGNVSTTSCDNPAHVAIAGVTFNQWSGGNMPQNQDQIYQYVDTQSSWNVLAYALLATALTMGAVAVVAPELFTGSGMLLAGAGGAAVYLGSNLIFNGTGNLTQAQNGFLGTTGNGWVQSEASAATGPFEPTFLSDIKQRADVPAGSGNSLSGVKQLYSGACPANITLTQCGSLDSGTMWRPESYKEYNSTLATRQRYQYCTAPAPNGMGLTGSAAEQCAAPATQPVN